MSHKSTAFVAAAAAALFATLAPLAQALTPQEQANVKLVSDFWRDVLQARNAGNATKYYAPDIKQHNPNVPSTLAGFQEFFGKIWKNPGTPKAELDPKPDEIVAQGDLVLLMYKHNTPEPTDASKTYESFGFDLFRVKDGKITEHWDAALKPTPKP